MDRVGRRGWLAAIGLVVLALAVRTPAGAEGGAAGRGGTWAPHLDRIERALLRSDPAAARAWHEASIAALGSWRRDEPIEVWDAFLRVGRVSGLGEAAATRARNLYLTAFFRAPQQASLDGVSPVAAKRWRGSRGSSRAPGGLQRAGGSATLCRD